FYARSSQPPIPDISCASTPFGSNRGVLGPGNGSAKPLRRLEPGRSVVRGAALAGQVRDGHARGAGLSACGGTCPNESFFDQSRRRRRALGLAVHAGSRHPCGQTHGHRERTRAGPKRALGLWPAPLLVAAGLRSPPGLLRLSARLGWLWTGLVWRLW